MLHFNIGVILPLWFFTLLFTVHHLTWNNIKVRAFPFRVSAQIQSSYALLGASLFDDAACEQRH